MKKMEQLLKEDRPIIAKLLGVPVSKLKVHGDVFLMPLKGKMKAADLKKLFDSSYGYDRVMSNIRNFYNEQSSDIYKKLIKIEGYVLDFHYSDRDGKGTMVLRKICPCCGKY